jgi:predicted dehydrogenase
MNVLFTGLGSIGQRHLRNLKRLLGDDIRVLAWRTRRLQRVLTDQLTVREGASLDEEFGIEVLDDLDCALAEQPDVVFVTNPSSMHLDVALAAARAGCNLFIEKPLATTMDGVDELVDLVERKGLVAGVGYQMRFHPCITLMKSVLDANTLGPPLMVHHDQGEYMPGWHPYEDYRQLFGARRDLGGGALLSQIHELDTVLWLYGMPERLFAIGGHFSSLDVDVEDVAGVLCECRFAGRALAVFVQQDYVRKPPVRTYRVVCDGGVLTADLIAAEVHVAPRGADSEVHRFPDFQRNDMFLAELRQFIDALDGRGVPHVQLREAAQSLRMAVAAHESMVSREAVTL